MGRFAIRLTARRRQEISASKGGIKA
jgi:hypothetical protein